MTEKHCKEFFVLFAAYLGADIKNAAYFNNQHFDEKYSKTKSAKASMDVNEVTPQMRHNISRRIWNNTQDETNVGGKEKQTDEASNGERQGNREGERARAKGNT